MPPAPTLTATGTHFGGTSQGRHFSQLKQIDRGNVGKLETVWAIPMGPFAPKPMAQLQTVGLKAGEPISTGLYADKVTWAQRIDLATGRSVENPGLRYHGKKGMFELWPGVRGAHSWLPQSFSPRTGLPYSHVIEGASTIGDEGLDIDNLPPALGSGAMMDPDLPGAWRFLATGRAGAPSASA